MDRTIDDHFYDDHSYMLLLSNLSVGLMPGFHPSVAVLPLPFRRCRYENSVRIPLHT